MEFNMRAIAHIKNDYPEKFGVPRQGGLVTGLPARIVFEKDFRRPEAFRGLEGFSHLWLIWAVSIGFSKCWSPTVRPPRLGGNKRVGVFATRSPNRPNPIGLTAVKLLEIDYDAPDGPALIVDGADLVNGTPILDIKPYLSYVDSIPEALDGFAKDVKEFSLKVEIPEELLMLIPDEKQHPLIQLLSQSPVPSYKLSEDKSYGLSFGNMNITFTVSDGVLRVTGVEKMK